jgi:hypothetical protein
MDNKILKICEQVFSSCKWDEFEEIKDLDLPIGSIKDFNENDISGLFEGKRTAFKIFVHNNFIFVTCTTNIHAAVIGILNKIIFSEDPKTPKPHFES